MRGCGYQGCVPLSEMITNQGRKSEWAQNSFAGKYFTLSLLEAFACKVDNVLLTVGTALSIPDITDVKLTDNELIGSW